MTALAPLLLAGGLVPCGPFLEASGREVTPAEAVGERQWEEPLTEGLLRRGELLASAKPRAARLALEEARALAEKDGLGELLAKTAAALARL